MPIFLAIPGFLCYNEDMKTTDGSLALQLQIDSLTARVDEQAELLAKLNALIDERNSMISKQTILIKHYEELLLLARRHRFGALSEKYPISGDEYRQIGLFGEVFAGTDKNASETDKNASEPQTEEITYKRRKHTGKREEDLSGLPVERVDHELPEDERACPNCGETMRDIGVDVRRSLKLIPAQVVVVEDATHAYACQNPACEEEEGGVTIVRAASPKPLISGSLASPSLVAHIALQKYSNGMPLYRIENGFRYDGINISRQTMANWVIKCAEIYLIAVYFLLKSYLIKENLLHADETTHQVLREPGRAAQSKSYEWIYRTSGCSEHNIVIYDYKETRCREHPKEFLKDFKGFLHTDGYEAYHGLPPDITVVGCWFHARQKWENLLKILPKDKRKGTDAERGVAYINRLFDLEREFKRLTPDERYKARLEQSKPIAEEFFVWAGNLGALPKSALGQAVGYAQSQYKYLMNVFLDGRLELSNNRAERSAKSFVLGRKAWLFSCTPEGAKASSIMYSIVETAKENNLHPYQYIKFLLQTLPNTTTGSLESLLPWSEAIPGYCRIPIKKDEAFQDAEKKRA